MSACVGRASRQLLPLLVQQTSQETRFSRDMYVRFGAVSQCVVRSCQQGGVANRIVTLKCALHRCLVLIYFRWPIPLCPMANNRATKRDPMLRHERSMRLQRLLCMFQTSIAKGRRRWNNRATTEKRCTDNSSDKLESKI